VKPFQISVAADVRRRFPLEAVSSGGIVPNPPPPHVGGYERSRFTAQPQTTTLPPLLPVPYPLHTLSISAPYPLHENRVRVGSG
jgi:hypothetical protein